MAADSVTTTQSSTLPPAQAAYVFRGHVAQIHAVHFLQKNLRLLSGDADGWVVCWNIPIKRPVAAWKPHNDSILGLGNWGPDKIITHGRDNKLLVWQLRQEEELALSKTLPVDDSTTERKQPWLLHSLDVNALNFCSFASCQNPGLQNVSTTTTDSADISIATPGVQDGWINVTSLPSEDRVATIPSPKDVKTGMIMTISLYYQEHKLMVLAGYESGHTAMWQQNQKQWHMVYMNKSHSQPILSLDIALDQNCYFTSSADAIIARHPLQTQSSSETKIMQTKHAGQQSLTVRSDGKIFGTAGWDGRLRIYSSKSMKELAVLKWHKEGCYALAFAEIIDSKTADQTELEGDQEVVERALTVSERRIEKAKSTHWVAAGSKDGKVSLWDIY